MDVVVKDFIEVRDFYEQTKNQLLGPVKGDKFLDCQFLASDSLPCI